MKVSGSPIVRLYKVSGLVSLDQIAGWSTQVFCITRNLDELVHFHFVDPVAAVFNAMRGDIPLSIQLGGALGVSSLNMLSGEANQTTRKIQQWAKQHISVRDTFLIAQVCLELLEGMSPEVAVYLAEDSVAKVLGLTLFFIAEAIGRRRRPFRTGALDSVHPLSRSRPGRIMQTKFSTGWRGGPKFGG